MIGRQHARTNVPTTRVHFTEDVSERCKRNEDVFTFWGHRIACKRSKVCWATHWLVALCFYAFVRIAQSNLQWRLGQLCVGWWRQCCRRSVRVLCQSIAWLQRHKLMHFLARCSLALLRQSMWLALVHWFSHVVDRSCGSDVSLISSVKCTRVYLCSVGEYMN